MPCGTKVGVAYVDMISVEPTPTEMVTVLGGCLLPSLILNESLIEWTTSWTRH